MVEERTPPRDGLRAALQRLTVRFFSKASAPSTLSPTPEDPPAQILSLRGAEVWTIDDLRNDILSLVDTATLHQFMTLDHQTCENIMRIKYRHLDWKMYKEMERLITPLRQPLYFAAVTTIDIRRPPREESGLRRESRSNYVARKWLPLLPSLPALQRARFEDLVLKKVSSLGGNRPKFEARRVICQPVNLAVKNPLSLANPCMVGFDFDIQPSIDVEFFSIHLRTDNPRSWHLRKRATLISNPSEPPKVFTKLLRQIAQSRDVFSHHIGALTLGAPLPLSDFASLYRRVDGHPRPSPPSNFRLDCTHYDVESLEAFCQAAFPTLVQLELGPVTSGIPTLTLEKLFLKFDWATLGSIRSFKVSVKMSTFDDWLAAFYHRTSYHQDRSCRSELSHVTIVFHGMPVIPEFYKVEADYMKQQYTDRILNQVMFDPFITRRHEIFHSGVSFSFKLWRDPFRTKSGSTIDLPLLDELVKEKIRNSRGKE